MMKIVSSTASIPAPVGGLNAKDAISNMLETEAPIMENWFPTPSDVQIRNGYRAFTTGLVNVETLMGYNNGSTQKLFSAANSSIYDSTFEGIITAPVVTSLSSTKFQFITMGTAGGYFLLAVNGENDLQLYDGTTWTAINGVSTPAITGVSTANIAHINNFKNRVFLIEKDTMKAWYLPVASIAGAASALDLSGLFKLGGYLMAMANWTIDNAAGIDDYAAFITSEGEVALYRGTDPSDTDNWALVGTFRIGKPIGRRCAIKAGADVLILTADGAFPLSKALLTDRGQLSQAITDKITNLILSDIRSYQSYFGWQAIIHPLGSKLIINVPKANNTAHQYVMNTQTGAWTKFTGWNALCWELLDDVLYFGASDGIYIADTGTSDNEGDILADVQQAFSYFGKKGKIKRFTMARPIFLAEGDITPAIVMNVDYEQRLPTDSPSFSGSAGPEWDVTSWDTTEWGTGDAIIKKWQSVTGVGYSGGLRIKTATRGIGCRWQASDIVYENGGVL